jgi:hypothetical protein
MSTGKDQHSARRKYWGWTTWIGRLRTRTYNPSVNSRSFVPFIHCGISPEQCVRGFGSPAGIARHPGHQVVYRNCPSNCANPPRGLHHKDIARGIDVIYGAAIRGSHRRNVRARGHRKVRVGFSAFDIKIALLIEGQSAWATGIRGTQLLQRGVPAGGAGGLDPG